MKARFFQQLCQELGADHDALLLHCETRWLSRGNVLERVFRLKEEMRQFLEQENQTALADLFGQEDFLLKLAYMSDIFSWLNKLNTQMQGSKKYYHDLVDMLDKFQAHLILVRKTVQEGDFSPFRNMEELITLQKIQSPNITFVSAHITALLDGFKKYFDCPDSVKFDWLRQPFNAQPPKSFTFAEKKEFIDVSKCSALRLQFSSMDLDAFWINVSKSYPLIGQRAVSLLLPFPTSYLCEAGFSAVASLKSKYRNKLNICPEVRAAISKLEPRFDVLCENHKAYSSH